MRKLGLISCLAIASLMSAYACTLDSSPDPSKDTSAVSNPGNPEAPSASPNETTAGEALGTTTDAVIIPDTCHVTLNFCDNPNSSTIGTDCTESGCTLSQAISACESIVSQKGCVQHCNAVMREGTSASSPIIDTWRVQCGSTCCGVGVLCGAAGRCCTGPGISGCPS